MEQMVRTFDALAFRIVADHEKIVWQILDLRERATMPIEPAIRANYPDAEITSFIPNTLTIKEDFGRFVLSYRLAEEFIRPLPYVMDIKAPDPLATLVQGFNILEKGESITYTLIVKRGIDTQVYKEGNRLVTQSTL